MHDMINNELDNDKDFIINDTQPDKTPVKIIKVVGVGGGGGNAVTYMYKKGIDMVTYALCNTDRQAMEGSPVPVKLVLGPSITKGNGAGNNPSVANEAAQESVPQITQMLQDGTEMVFITAGMGGGTGTGAAPVVARVAKEMGILTIGIVTIPFVMEGPTKITKAIKGVKEMSKYVDAMLVINNEILIEQFGDLDLITAFAKADDTLSNAANSIAEIIYSDGYINVDFKDVQTTLRNGGVAVISTGYGEGERRVSAAIDDALNSPLLRKNEISTSKRILFNLYSSRNAEHPLKMSEMNEFTELTKKISGLDLIYGITYDDSLGDKVKVSILASGFESDVLKDSDEVDVNPHQEQSIHEEEKLIETYYGRDKVNSFKVHKNSVNFITLSKEQMDNDTVLELLENNPAYNRSNHTADDIRAGRTVNEIDLDSPVTINSTSKRRRNQTPDNDIFNLDENN